MKKVSLLATVIVLLATTAVAQSRFLARRSAITVTVNSLNCTTSLGAGIFSALSWAFNSTETGVSSGTGSGAGTGKATSGITITKLADACTPQLFEGGTEGKAFSELIVTQQDERGHTYKITLKNALISSYQLQGSESENRPTEQISFAFESLQIVF